MQERYRKGTGEVQERYRRGSGEVQESLEGSGFAKRGCDHCCEVGPPRRMGRGGSRRGSGVGRINEKQWLVRRRDADSR